MSRQNWTASNPLSVLEQTMGRVFDDMYRRHAEGDESVVQSAWTPAVDVREEDDGISILVELPGVVKKEIDISLDSGVLTVSGERKLEGERDKYHRIERAYGKFSRSFRLPRDIDGTKVQATFKEGVLTLALPKAEEAKPRQIVIA